MVWSKRHYCYISQITYDLWYMYDYLKCISELLICVERLIHVIKLQLD